MKPEFRAWDKKTKEMYAVVEMGWRDGFEVRIGYLKNPSWGSRPRTLDEVELMQFTGLFDSKGKEVFEGDILHRDGFSDWVVVWGNAGFHIYNICNPERTHQIEYSLFDREVIGNIYEPEKAEGSEG